MYVRTKQIPPDEGNWYRYLVRAERKNDQVQQKVVKYLGKATGPDDHSIHEDDDLDDLPDDIEDKLGTTEEDENKSDEEDEKFKDEYLEDKEAHRVRRIVIDETKKAVKIRTKDGKEVWVPKSQIDIHENEFDWGEGEQYIIADIPDWLAEEKGVSAKKQSNKKNAKKKGKISDIPEEEKGELELKAYAKPSDPYYPYDKDKGRSKAGERGVEMRELDFNPSISKLKRNIDDSNFQDALDDKRVIRDNSDEFIATREGKLEYTGNQHGMRGEELEPYGYFKKGDRARVVAIKEE